MVEERGAHARWFVIALIGSLMVCLTLCGFSYAFIRWASERSEVSVDVEVPSDARPIVTPPVEPPAPPSEKSLPLRMAEQLAQVTIPTNETIRIAERLLGIEDVDPIVAHHAAPIPVGSVKQFWVGDADTIDHRRISARLVYATEHVYFWIEEGVEYEDEEVRELVEDLHDTPRSCFTTSEMRIKPAAITGCPLKRPPEGLTGSLPLISKSPSSSRAPALPSSQSPIASSHMSS